MTGRLGRRLSAKRQARHDLAGFFVAFGCSDALSRWVKEHHGHTRSQPLTQPHPTADLIDIAAVAQRLGVQVRHVRRLVHERRIPYIKWGQLLRFDPADIDTWIDAARQSGAK